MLPSAGSTSYHVPVGGGAVCAAAEWAEGALVALLVARVAHRVVRVPARGGARARRPCAAVRAHAAALPQNIPLQSLLSPPTISANN